MSIAALVRALERPDHANEVWNEKIIENLTRDAEAGLDVDIRVQAPFATWAQVTV